MQQEQQKSECGGCKYRMTFVHGQIVGGERLLLPGVWVREWFATMHVPIEHIFLCRRSIFDNIGHMCSTPEQAGRQGGSWARQGRSQSQYLGQAPAVMVNWLAGWL